MKQDCGRGMTGWQGWVAWAAFGVALGVGAEEPHRHRIGVSGRVAFQVEASFRNLGGYRTPTDPGPAAGGGMDRDYEDGFVRVDSSGNLDGETWYWGYEDTAKQEVGGAILMHAFEAPATPRSDVTDDPHLGFEVTYGYLWKKGRGVNWLLEAGLGWTDFSFRDGREFTRSVTRTTDAFALGGVVPPIATPEEPYSGTFEGPGPLLGDAPTRRVDVLAEGAVLTGERELQAQVGSVRLGPAVEWPLTDRFSIQAGAGLALAYVDGEFTLAETHSIREGPTLSRYGSTSKTGVLAGAYAEGVANLRLNRDMTVFAGGQYQYLPDFTQRLDGREAVLRFGEGFFLTFGFRYGF